MALSAPIHVHWELTNICNLKCLHCYQQMDRWIYQSDRSQLLRIAKNIVHSGVFQVTLTGGEPFSISCLQEISEFILSHGVSLHITSNGTLIDKGIAKWIADFGIPIQISLDSYNQERFDHIRQNEGAFFRVLKAIEYLNNSGAKSSIAFCANRINYRDIAGVANLIFVRGIKKMLVGEIIPLFGLNSIMNDLLMNPSEYREFLQLALQTKKSYVDKLDITISTEWGFLYTNEFDHAPCTAMDRDMAILADGNVYPCPFIRDSAYIIGNVIENNLKDIWHSDCAEKFRKSKHNGCTSESCLYFEQCKSGCKAILANCAKPIDRRDPRCPLPLMEINTIL